MNDSILNSDYRAWLVELKTTIKQSRIKAALSVNSELIKLYWDMGKQLNEKQSYYKNKFNSLNAIDKFDSEEVQGLIVKSLNEVEAKEKLSDMLIELVSTLNETPKEKGNITIPSDAVKTLNSMADIEIPNEKEIKNDFDSQFTI